MKKLTPRKLIGIAGIIIIITSIINFITLYLVYQTVSLSYDAFSSSGSLLTDTFGSSMRYTINNNLVTFQILEIMANLGIGIWLFVISKKLSNLKGLTSDAAKSLLVTALIISLIVVFSSTGSFGLLLVSGVFAVVGSIIGLLDFYKNSLT